MHKLEKWENSQIDHLTSHLKTLVKEEQNKSTACRKEEGIEIRAEVSEIENKNNRGKSMKKKKLIL